MMKHVLLFLFLFYLLPTNCLAKTIYDSPKININRMMRNNKGDKYIVSYPHSFSDTLFIPKDCELYFNGGSLSGPIVMNNTLLTGSVNLKGSTISGIVRNDIFYASWLCNMDGKTDDARHVNEMIEVCGCVYFPRGCYRLISHYYAGDNLISKLHSAVQSHIGIYKSGVSLIGETGTEFLTEEPLVTICVYTRPNMLEKSIRNILIKGITFTVKNDGKSFHEFMHTIKLIGVNNITIKDCTFNDFWGDAICLSHYGDNKSTGERTRNQNVNIINNTIIGGESHNNRNGISVVNGKNVLIKDNIIKNTSRRDMPGGIDIEPNNSAYTINNIKIENNTIANVKGAVGAIGLALLRGGASAYRITIRNNKISNCSWGIKIVIKTKGTSDGLEITDNVIDANTRPFRFGGGGSSRNWKVKNNIILKPAAQKIPGDIKVDNLKFGDNKDIKNYYHQNNILK